ncbi:MAG: TonB-dependent receptor [Sphingomonas sp.]|uniref:TonB-dependent receptor n=1 Tax=Sphingomonas sp. TaxID=28214 RepID=UPI0025DB93FB|nr:TonB-dependent receptor [Sphingomonas sp.]MBQ1500714.1 TonB-dependent receptor [Sphingomonas sp.]
MQISHMLTRTSFTALLLTASVPALAQAQEAASPATDATTPDEEIIVTGRAGAGERTKLDTSYAVTTLSNDMIRSRAPSSVTETLKSVPGFWVEASGGEGSGNVRARGIPVDGFGSINLLEDGLPVQHDPALGYLNADQAFRIDESIERIEVVRGGPSSVFYSNAPGGVVNYITRRAGDSLTGNARVLYGPTAELYRFDGWIGAPLGEGLKLGVGGFYRSEQGVRDPGFTGNKGGQIRADLVKEFDGGSLTFSYKHLDDNAIFYTGIPLTKDSKGKIVGLPGFDPHYGTTASPASAKLALRSATGIVNFDNTKGTDIRLDQGSVLTDYEFAPGWKLTNGMRYRDSYTVRNGVYPTSVATAASFLASNRAALLAAFPGATDVQIRYADNGQAFNVASQNGNGDIFINAARPVTVWEREFLNDFRIAHKFEAAGTHDLAFGFYYANIDETFSRYSASTVQDVSNNSRLLDVVAVNAAGSVVGSLTKNGVARYGSEFANGTGSQTTIALYASDEWQITPTLRFDGGIRWEQMKATGAQEGQKTVNLGDPTTLADDNVLTGSGVFTNFDRKFDSIGYTAGLDWQFAKVGGVFARYTHAFRMPSVGSFITSATAQPVIQGIDMWEAGLKLSTPLISVYATGFLTDYDSYSIGNFVFAPPPATGVIQQTVYTDTRAYGVELEATLRPVKWFDFTVQATIQEPTFRNLRYNENTSGGLVARNYSGNQLLRVPKLSLRATPAVTLFDGRLRAQMDVEHYGDRYADAANTSKLPAYTVINASVSLGLTKNIRLWAYGDNLTNTIGLTEGNPRAGELTSGQANDLLFIGRPIVGRNIRFAVDFSF